jgi:glycine/D-amino acid oxidase-like deaminating enzyme
MAKIVVIGSGFSGLSAALHLSAAQHHVVILEAKQRIGGRGTSELVDRISFGFGPHLLLKHGPTHRLVKKLSRVRLHVQPLRVEHIVTTNGLLRPQSYAGIAEFRRAIRTMDDSSHAVQCLNLLATYGMDLHSSSERIKEFAKHNAMVTAEGWAGIIGRFASALDEIGVYVETNCKVASIGDNGVQLVDKRKVDADAVVLACGPTTTKKLLKPLGIGELQPIHQQYASTIDVSLSSNPMGNYHSIIDPEQKQFVYHLSRIQPRMVHPGSILSAAKLISSPNENGLGTLSTFLDERLAGWRQHVVHVREQASIPVWMRSENSEDMFAEHGLYLAGDWLASDYLLADAAVESGKIVASKLRS